MTETPGGVVAVTHHSLLSVRLIRGVRQQCDLTRALDGSGELSLVLAAIARLAGLTDATAVIGVLAHEAQVLVVHDEGASLGTEVADLPALAPELPTGRPAAPS